MAAARATSGGRDGVARGYATVDVVHGCSFLNPLHPEYFETWVAHDNVLWGDFFYVNPGENFAQGDSLVHIEASATDPETSVAGEYTFYGRYVAWTAADNREPLTALAVALLERETIEGDEAVEIMEEAGVSRPAWLEEAVEAPLVKG